MAPSKKHWSLHSFVAHSSNVNCLALGQKSGSIMATGGHDKKINLWTIGEPQCLMSLNGHNSPINCVQFGIDEELVIGGSVSGNIKIWNLVESKVKRKMVVHKAAVNCLHVHPCGTYMTSGSLDTNVALWDIRKGICAFSYKGHKASVNSVKFSPDGNWIVSASDDGYVKVWDLKAGKLLKDIKVTNGAALHVEFSPTEFLMCTTSTDRTIQFWDMETFDLISSTDCDVNPTTATLFHSEGNCMYAGTKDYCKVVGWEPVFIHDSVKVGWGRIADIAIRNNHLIGASFQHNVVSTYAVDLQKLGPFQMDLGSDLSNKTMTPINSPIPQKINSSCKQRKSFDRNTSANKIPLRLAKQRSNSSPDSEPSEESDFDANHRGADIFRPSKHLNRSPQPVRDITNDINILNLDDLQERQPEYGRVAGNRGALPSTSGLTSNDPYAPATSRRSAVVQPTPAHCYAPSSCSSSSTPASNSSSMADCLSHKVAAPSSSSTSCCSSSSTNSTTSSSAHHQSAVAGGGGGSVSVSRGNSQPSSRPGSRPTSRPGSRPTSRPGSRPSSRPTSRHKQDEKLDDTLTSGTDYNTPTITVARSKMSDNYSQLIEEMDRGHSAVNAIMITRHQKFISLMEFIVNKNINTALLKAMDTNDLSVLMDLVNVLLDSPEMWSLDMFHTLCTKLAAFTSSKYEPYVIVGIRCTCLLLQNYGELIKSCIVSKKAGMIDIVREERNEKCQFIYKNVVGAYTMMGMNLSPEGNKNIREKVHQFDMLFTQFDGISLK